MQSVRDRDIFGNDIRRRKGRKACCLRLKAGDPQSFKNGRKEEKVSRAEPARYIRHNTGKVHLFLESLFAHMGTQHLLVLTLSDQHEPGVRHFGNKLGHHIDCKFLVFLEVKTSDADDDIFVRPVRVSPRLAAEGISSCDPILNLLDIDGVPDHDSRMLQFPFSAAPGVEPLCRIFGTGPEIRGVFSHSPPVCFVQHPAKLRVHVLRIVAVNDPPGDPVFFSHLQVVNVGKTVDIDPDRLIFLCVFFKKSFQFPAETDRILSSGRKMHRPAAHGMDLILESHRIIGIAKEIKMKPAAVDPPVIVHKKTFHPAGVLCHTENKDIIHDCHDLRCQFSNTIAAVVIL